MVDLSIYKLLLIGVVALVVLGPEKLPRVARTVGNLLGRAQRYVADVKSEVNRQMELEELKRMKSEMESAAQDLQQTVEKNVGEAQASFEQNWSEATAGLQDNRIHNDELREPPSYYAPDGKPSKRNQFRKKQGAVPQWYKRKAGIRTRALSGAARVAKYRPKLKA
jgi:sec-independent protein translocase protein TatB